MGLDVCLVYMPYGTVTAPSISIGSLLAEAKRDGLNAQAVYATFWFAEKMGLAHYSVLSDSAVPQDLLGEWTFSGAAFPGFEPDHEAFLAERLERVGSLFGPGDLRETFWAIRRQAEAFVTTAAERVLALDPRIVGCSSTFQQHCASLALLRKIKELSPGVVTMLGGANCAGAMGQTTQQAFPWLDMVVSGEADIVFPALCRALLEKGRPLSASELPAGIVAAPTTMPSATLPRSTPSTTSPAASTPSAGADGRRTLTVMAPPIARMDDLAVPDYDDYFRQLETFPYKEFLRPGLPVETSRGCWWGQKSLCTFCGLFETGLEFRSKSDARVLDELHRLSERHTLPRFAATDLILDMKYFKTLLPRLAGQEPPPYLVYYETKANLTEDHVKLLADAGVRWIQPGIESLNDEVLKAVRKGNTALGNVGLLKYSLENGIWVLWNMLTGVPGEDPAWYREMASWLPQIFHLQPPSSIVSIRYDRFSPYWEQSEQFGLTLDPDRSYSSVYPLPVDDLRGLAYFFEDRKVAQAGGRTKDPELLAVEGLVKEWRRLHYAKAGGASAPVLSVREGEGRSVVTDTRPCAVAASTVLDGLTHVVYQACRRHRTGASFAADLQASLPGGASAADVDEAVQFLVERRLLLRLNGRLLALATREPARAHPSMIDFPGGFNYAVVRPHAARMKHLYLTLADAMGA
jgi:magnesium-protoporphyrin IX monomethyl ester (oxidative) cyclase